jgi:3'(2'), 5'-bisphosphate nucleotidase
MSSLSDVAVARAAAAEAADVLVALRTAFPDAPDLKDRADRAAHETILGVLARFRPDDAVLSEEGVDDPVRLSADRVWIVDPLDGTKEYAQGRHDWAVHVALWQRAAGDLTDGVVALPGVGEVLASDAVSGPAGSLPPRPRFAVSRSRATELTLGVAEDLDGELVPLGSAGFKVAAVVRGEVDAYVHTGGQYEWDSAAPVAVARAAGLHASRVDGSPLLYNRPDPSLPDLVVCRPELADRVLSAVARRTGERVDHDGRTSA